MWLNTLIFLLPILYSMFGHALFTMDPDIERTEIRKNSRHSDIELKALEEFRPLVNDIISENKFYKTDNFLLRWIRARNLNVNAAHQMIREAKQWRDENHINTILDENISLHATPYTFEGYDREGRPVILLNPLKNDVRKLVLSGKRANVLRFFDQMLEFGLTKAINSTKLMSNGEPVTQFIVIMDFEGINVRQHLCVQCMPIYLEQTYHYENYYPGSMKYCVMINVNKVAMTLMEFLKPFLSDATKPVLKIFGTNRSEWTGFLRSIIDPNQLPSRFGGTKTSY